MDKEILYLIDRYYQVMKHRIAINNQIDAMERDNQSVNVLKDYRDKFLAIENDIAKYIGERIKDCVMWDWLEKVKGIGPILAAGLVSSIDIKKADHASSVWKYAGLDVASDGKGRSKRKEHLVEKEYIDKDGKKKIKNGITFNPFLKTVCWKIGEQFVKSKGEYRDVYDASRKFYDLKFPKEVKKDGKTYYTKGHKYAMAKRRTVKLFLSHFWAEWRKREGLEVSLPFSHKGLSVDK